MIYIKSILVGVVAVLLAGLAIPILAIVGMVVYNIVHSSSENGAIGWDPISLIRLPLPLIVCAVMCFVAGFGWEFRRLRR